MVSHINIKSGFFELKNGVLKHGDAFATFVLASAVFLFSRFLFKHYNSGDLYFYRAAYEVVSTGGYKAYREVMYSADVIHFFVISIFSRFVAHDVLMAALNSILSGAIYYWLRIHGVNVFISVLSVFLNYYLWVVFIPAERLKIGFLFFVFCFLISNRVLRAFLAILSILSHLSLIIGFFAYFCVSGRWRRVEVFWLLCFAILILMIYVFNPDHYEFHEFIRKIDWYSRSKVSWFAIFPTLIICCFSLYFYRANPLGVVLAFLGISLLVYWVGPDRINMFSALMGGVLIVVGGKPRGWEVALLCFLVVLCLKMVLFVKSILIYGSGFHSNTLFPY